VGLFCGLRQLGADGRMVSDQMERRLARIEVLAWAALGVSVVTLLIIAYWSIRVIEAAHRLNNIVHGG
jgi:hypothetical protein